MSKLMRSLKPLTSWSAKEPIALAVRTDVSNSSDVEALAERAFETFGTVNLLCNNAGVAAGTRVWELTLNDWAWVLGVNLWGTIHGIKAFVPRMLESGDDGHIVNTASGLGMYTAPGAAAYSSSKFAVVMP